MNFFLYFRIILEDQNLAVLPNFLCGTYSYTVELWAGEYYPNIKAAAEELIEELPSKRTQLEEKFQRPSDYGKVIVHTEGIHDHRFTSDLHVSLQVEGFGEFMDTINSEECIDSKYYVAASALMQQMSGVFNDEKERVNTFKNIVQGISSNFRFATLDRRGYRTDCTVEVDGNPIANWEFKNEFFGNSACPVRQNNAHFIHLKKGGNDRSPMLLVSVVGCHYLQVFGAVWFGVKYACIDPLCSPLSLLYVPRDPNNGVSKVARLLAAIDLTTSKLVEYYGKSEEERVTNNRWPYWTDSGRLQYEGRLVRTIKWLFEAKHSGKANVIVKFARHHYGINAHQLLASLDYAPKLISVEQLPGGWCAVVMEKKIGKQLSHQSSEEVKFSLKTAVERMHGSNYVHGDLRPQNILVVGEKVCILDFDWANDESRARYPPELTVNEDYNWHPDVHPAGKICKAHDMFQVDLICN